MGCSARRAFNSAATSISARAEGLRCVRTAERCRDDVTVGWERSSRQALAPVGLVAVPPMVALFPLNTALGALLSTCPPLASETARSLSSIAKTVIDAEPKYRWES